MLDLLVDDAQRKRRVTLKDIAALAGVGTATVERALNNRGNVRPETCRKILNVARELNYFPSLPMGHHGVIRLDVLLVRPETLFYSRINSAFERLAASLGKDVVIHRSFVKEADIAGFVEKITNPPYQRSALILACPAYPAILSALRDVADSGLPVVQIVTRNLPDLPYVGIDNHAAGRTAALCMKRSLVHGNGCEEDGGKTGGHRRRRGSVIALCHSMAYANHRERIEGFSGFLAEQTDDRLFLRDVLFDRDDPDEAARLVHQAIVSDPDLVGIYTAGGDSLHIGTVLKKHAARALCWIGHEVNDATRRSLADGTMTLAIDQTPEHQAGIALTLCLQKLGIIPALVEAEPPKFRLVTPENLD